MGHYGSITITAVSPHVFTCVWVAQSIYAGKKTEARSQCMGGIPL